MRTVFYTAAALAFISVTGPSNAASSAKCFPYMDVMVYNATPECKKQFGVAGGKYVLPRETIAAHKKCKADGGRWHLAMGATKGTCSK